MSRKGDCRDNAALESYFTTHKQQRFYRQEYNTQASARHKFFEYNEAFYNREWLSSSLKSQRLEMSKQAV
ncbi:MAG: hypothetical protein KDA70_21210 [Planctomycetaceae bacterium]|nr:hypothetical protein [Planctomycetaceae bacterium]